MGRVVCKPYGATMRNLFHIPWTAVASAKQQPTLGGTIMKWELDDNTGDIRSGQSRIACVYGATKYNRSTSAAKCMRTARLIAAAPELYELLDVLSQLRVEPDLMTARQEARKLIAHINGRTQNE